MAKLKNKQRGFRRKSLRILFRIGFGLILAVVLFFLALFLVVHIFSPPEQVKEIAIKTVNQELGKNLSIGQASLNLFKGFQLQDIVLTSPDSVAGIDTFPVQSASIRRISMNYSLLGLLKKQFVLQSLVIDDPELVLEFDSDLADEQISSMDSVTLQGSENIVLPIKIHLNEISIRNGKVDVTARGQNGHSQLQLDHITLDLNDIHLPHGALISDSTDLRGKLHLSADASRLFLLHHVQSPAMQTLLLHSQVNSKIEVDINRVQDIGVALQLDLQQTDFSFQNATHQIDALSPYTLHLDLKGEANLLDTLVNVQSAAFLVDRVTWLQLEAKLAQQSSGLSFDGRVIESRIPFSQLDGLSRDFLPAGWAVVWHDQKGELSLQDTWFRGTLSKTEMKPVVEFQTNFKCKNLGATINQGEYEIEQLNISALVNGRLNDNGVNQVSADAQMSLDSLSAVMQNNFVLFSGPLHLQVHAKLDSANLPTLLSVEWTAENLLNAQANAKIDLSGDRFEDLAGTANVSVSRLQTQVLPNMPLSSVLNANLEIDVYSLHQIDGALTNHSDSLFYYQKETYGFPPLTFTGRWQGDIDLLAQSFRIDSLQLQLNDILYAMAFASLSDDQIQVQVSQLEIRHQPLYRMVPREIRDQLYDLRLGGSTRLQATASGSKKDSLLTYRMDGKIRTVDMRIDYPSKGLVFDGIHLDLDLRSRSDQLYRLAAALTIDEILVDLEQKMRYLDNHFSFNLESRDGSEFQLNDGQLELPDLCATGRFAAILDDLPTNPQFSGQLELDQVMPDTIVLADLVGLRGDQRLSANFSGDQFTIHLRTFYDAEHLDVSLPGEIRVRDINAHLDLEQSVDLHAGKLIMRNESPILTPSNAALDYTILRDYYRASVNKRSTLSVGAIEAAGYAVSNVNAEMYLGEGWVEIPFLQAQSYGGTILSRFAVDLAAGDLRNANYPISAHFNEVNSELLLPADNKEQGRGIINGNLTLDGKGLDPQHEMMVGGYFYITEIGPRVVSNLLRALDPRGTDTGVSLTQQLIGLGFKPSLVSFLIRQGYFYPAIYFDQPWYFPVRLSEGKVELSRVPVQFFLQTALQPPGQMVKR
jgi:hypothetical protein